MRTEQRIKLTGKMKKIAIEMIKSRIKAESEVRDLKSKENYIVFLLKEKINIFFEEVKKEYKVYFSNANFDDETMEVVYFGETKNTIKGGK